LPFPYSTLFRSCRVHRRGIRVDVAQFQTEDLKLNDSFAELPVAVLLTAAVESNRDMRTAAQNILHQISQDITRTELYEDAAACVVDVLDFFTEAHRLKHLLRDDALDRSRVSRVGLGAAVGINLCTWCADIHLCDGLCKWLLRMADQRRMEGGGNRQRHGAITLGLQRGFSGTDSVGGTGQHDLRRRVAVRDLDTGQRGDILFDV